MAINAIMICLQISFFSIMIICFAWLGTCNSSQHSQCVFKHILTDLMLPMNSELCHLKKKHLVRKNKCMMSADQYYYFMLFQLMPYVLGCHGIKLTYHVGHFVSLQLLNLAHPLLFVS